MFQKSKVLNSLCIDARRVSKRSIRTYNEGCVHTSSALKYARAALCPITGPSHKMRFGSVGFTNKMNRIWFFVMLYSKTRKEFYSSQGQQYHRFRRGEREMVSRFWSKYLPFVWNIYRKHWGILKITVRSTEFLDEISHIKNENSTHLELLMHPAH